MVRPTDNQPGVLQSLDYWTIGIYLCLLLLGWLSVCGASYTIGDTNIFSLDTRSGMQIVRIGTSIVLALVILLLDDSLYDTFAYVIYGGLLLLLFFTIFNPHEIKGSRSWLVMGPVRLQPAEFAKFATALALARTMNIYGFDLRQGKHFLQASAIILLPILFIVAQKETGSALVYISFLLMFYREGMTGCVLFTGIALVVYFVVGIRFADVVIGSSDTRLGTFLVLMLVQIFTALLIRSYCHNRRLCWRLIAVSVGVPLAALLVSLTIVTFNVMWVQLFISVGTIVYIFYLGLTSRWRNYLLITAFAAGSLLFFFSASHVLNNVMGAHQRERINVLLGLKDDPTGAGYNVHQSQIAIGSGGFTGKGFLNGTQTKLKFVPEQDTDFIFCTVGEEEGFVGASLVLLLFLALILRLIKMAERQPLRFGRVYGYCVVGIFLFHGFVNVGMVLGLTPVIGIPLPFFSYGGSSLWGFTILLFIFLRIDAGRNLVRT